MQSIGTSIKSTLSRVPRRPRGADATLATGGPTLRSRLFVDRRASALSEAGDFLLAKNEGLVGDDHILGELGELLAGQVTGRAAPHEITLFKSVGLAVEDLAAAHYVYKNALDLGIGTRVEFGGDRLASD